MDRTSVLGLIEVQFREMEMPERRVTVPRRGDRLGRSQGIVYHDAPVIARQAIEERFMFYVYGLHLAGDNEIRYVGSTCNPQSRLWQHLCRYDEGNPDKEKWVADNRQNVRMKILQSGVSEKDRRKAEQRAILECKGKGHRLLNARSASRKIGVTREEVAWWLDRIEGDGNSL